MPFKKYLIIVLLASLPRIFWLQFICAGIRGFSPEKMMLYFSKNQTIFTLSLIYFLITLIVAFKIKKKLK